MRYKKGSEVEVFCKDEVPSGSWRCGQVICGNGHHYTIRCIIGAKDEAIFERVSRKSIRPCPPVVHVSRSWMPGDVVEMLHNYSWKMATVSKVLKGNHFLVRLVGSSNEFKVHKFDIRLRQSWMDGKWIVVGKVPAIIIRLDGQSWLPVRRSVCSFVPKLLSPSSSSIDRSLIAGSKFQPKKGCVSVIPDLLAA